MKKSQQPAQPKKLLTVSVEAIRKLKPEELELVVGGMGTLRGCYQCG
jgi:hypothetical protein